tara:strand:+ start:842 stop:1081 length:240 start_codon:yes stop_codon:yes gene_type:complete
VICSGLSGTYKIIQFIGNNGNPLAYSHLSSTTASISAHGVYNCPEGTEIRITNGSDAAVTFTGSNDAIGSYFYGYRVSE